MRDKKAESLGLFIAGVLAGAAFALLYAPSSGVRTRKQIRRYARRKFEQLDDLQDDIRSQVNGWVEDVAETLDDGLHSGKRLTLAGRERVLGVFDDAKRRVEEGKSRIEGLIGK